MSIQIAARGQPIAPAASAPDLTEEASYRRDFARREARKAKRNTEPNRASFESECSEGGSVFFDSRQDRLDNLSSDIGQAEISPLEAINQAQVVDAKEGQDRRVQVMHVNDILDGAISEFVGRRRG